MMSFGVVGWILLSGLTAGEPDITVSGCVGEYISFSCSYHLADTNTKYFCRDPCTADQDILVRSDWSPTGRYRLEDLGNGHSTVTITDLQKSDAGTYWCGVDRSVKDTYHKVHLTVTDAPTSNLHPPKATPKTAPPRTVGSNEPSTFPQSTIPPCTTSPSTISSSTPKPTLPAQHSLDISSSTSGTPLYAVGGLVCVVVFGLAVLYKITGASRNPKPESDPNPAVSFTAGLQDELHTLVYFTVINCPASFTPEPPSNPALENLLYSEEDRLLTHVLYSLDS